MELKAVLLGGNSTTTGIFYETTCPMANGQWKESTSFRESARFPAWKHLEADPWGATSRRHTGKHSDGWCAQPWA